MNKLFLTIVALLLMASTAFGATGQQIQFVNEWGDPVDMTTGVSIYVYEVGTTTEIVMTLDRPGNTVVTQPVTDTSTNTPLDYTVGLMDWFQPKAGFKIVATDGTYTRTVDNLTGSDRRIYWPSTLTAEAGLALGASDYLDFTAGGFRFNGPSSGLLNLVPDSDGGSFRFGSATLQTDILWYAATGNSVLFDESGSDLDIIDVDVGLDDDALLQFGTSDDITVQFDSANFEIFCITQDVPLALGGVTNGFDVTYYFETAGQFRTDYDADFINLTDGMDLRFGTGASSDGDFLIDSSAGNVLNISQVVADTGTMTIGADGTDIPLTWYAETGSDFALLTGDDLQLEDVSLCLADGTELQFGDALGTGVVTLSCTSNLLTVGQVAAGTGAVAFGVNDAGVDVSFFGDTSSNIALWDASDDRFELTDVDILFLDNGDLIFGTDLDWVIDSDTAKTLDFIPLTTDETSVINIGANTAGADLKIFGATTGEYWSYDADVDSIIVNTGNALYTMTDAEANQFKVDATGTVAGIAIQLETTDGGVHVNADGAANGDVTLDAADDVIITADGVIAADGAVIQTDRETQIHTTNDTMDTAADVGRLHQSLTDGVVWTLPAVATGLTYTFMNTGADGAVEVHVDTNGSDLIIGGCGFTALDDGDKLTNTKASADVGDYVTITYGNANGWYITDMVGTWADGGA